MSQTRMVSASATKTGMARLAAITGVELPAPQIEQRQGLLAIPHLIAQVIRDAAVGIDAVEVRPQPGGQKPRGHMKVLVVGGGQSLAVGARLFQGRALLGDAVFRRQRGPAAFYQFPIVLSTLDCHCFSLPQGLKPSPSHHLRPG